MDPGVGAAPPARPSDCPSDVTCEAGLSTGTVGLGRQPVETLGAEDLSRRDPDYPSIEAGVIR